jgi:hypothetical protein
MWAGHRDGFLQVNLASKLNTLMHFVGTNNLALRPNSIQQLWACIRKVRCLFGPASGLGYTRFAWAGGTFSPVVLLCQFFVLAGNRFWFYIITYVT